jgi:hypothetical protein
VKTISLKKIALVAVSALGISLVGAPASNAAIVEVTYDKVTAIGLYQVTSTPVVGAAVQVNVGMTTAALSGSAQATLVGQLSAYPAGAFVQVSAANTITGGSAGSFANHFGTGSAASVAGAALTLPGGANGAALLAGSTAAAVGTGVGSMSFTPTAAGSYTLTVWHQTSDGGSTNVDYNETRQTIAITVAAAPSATGGASVMTIKAGAVTSVGGGSASDLRIYGSRSVGTQRAIIGVAVKGSTGAAFTGATVEAVTTAGLVRVVAGTEGTAAAVGLARSSSLALSSSQSDAVVHISGDNTSGVGTITVNVTDPVSGIKTAVGTATVTFYSTTVATLTATQVYANIGAATTHGCAAAACVGTTYSTGSSGKPAVVLVAKDSSGTVIPDLSTIVATSSDLTQIAGSTVVAVTEAGATAGDANGRGYYNASITGAASAASGKTATVTYSYTNTSAPFAVISSAAQTFTIGGTTIVTETLGFDKTSYAPGEAMVVSRTAKDSAGNPVADGTAAGAVTFSKPVGGTAPAAGFYVKGTAATSATTPSVFAPSVAGAFSASMTGGDAAATVRTGSASVTDANAGLVAQIDALNAKIVALNALIAKIMKKLGVK